jgi:hypothetical protein
MIAGDLMWLRVAPERAEAYLRRVLDGYLEGLGAAKAVARADVELAAFGSAALRAAVFFPYLLKLLAEPGLSGWRRFFPGAPSRTVPRFGQAMGVLLELGRRAALRCPVG